LGIITTYLLTFGLGLIAREGCITCPVLSKQSQRLFGDVGFRFCHGRQEKKRGWLSRVQTVVSLPSSCLDLRNPWEEPKAGRAGTWHLLQHLIAVGPKAQGVSDPTGPNPILVPRMSVGSHNCINICTSGQSLGSLIRECMRLAFIPALRASSTWACRGSRVFDLLDVFMT